MPSVLELKATLDEAHVSYDGVTEKEELISLVEVLETKNDHRARRRQDESMPLSNLLVCSRTQSG